MPAFVIRANDGVEFVVIGDEAAAKAKTEELARADYVSRPWDYENSYEKYRRRIYWRPHEVPAEIV